MNIAPFAVGLVALMAASPTAAAHRTTTHGFPNSVLIAAAKTSPLRLIDSLETYCDGETPIDAWLKALVAGQARRIAWTAGPCELVNDLNPLDAGGSYCVQANITLAHPKNRHDIPEIEIYLEDPKRGKPGAAYAFRAAFDGADGPDYIRFRKDFDSEWRDRFKDAPPRCTDQ